jgi:hypothetical protein
MFPIFFSNDRDRRYRVNDDFKRERRNRKDQVGNILPDLQVRLLLPELLVVARGDGAFRHQRVSHPRIVVELQRLRLLVDALVALPLESVHIGDGPAALLRRRCHLLHGALLGQRVRLVVRLPLVPGEVAGGEEADGVILLRGKVPEVHVVAFRQDLIQFVRIAVLR